MPKPAAAAAAGDQAISHADNEARTAANPAEHAMKRSRFGPAFRLALARALFEAIRWKLGDAVFQGELSARFAKDRAARTLVVTDQVERWERADRAAGRDGRDTRL